jgi:VWFA-related protein
MRGIAAVMLAMVWAAGSEPVASGQFRSGTALVIVDVVATRQDGNLARDLTQADFQVFEDNRPQAIRQFQVVDLERASERSPDPPGVFTNRGEPGAVFALVLDDMTLAARHTGRMRDWATRFLSEHVRPGDYVGVMRSGANSPLFLTTDRALAAPVIAQASGRGGGGDVGSITGTGGDTVPIPGGDAPTMPDFSALGLLDASATTRIVVERSLAMTQRVVEYLARIPARRKAVLLFSQGMAFDLEAFASPDSASQSEVVRRLLATAREGNVAIYTIDPRGLPGSTEPDIGATAAPSSADPAIDALRDLAAATGGRAIVSTNQIDIALTRIADENRFYYLIGYEPSEPARSRPRPRRIEVRTRAPGVTLLHRRAYVPSAAAALAKGAKRSIVASPLPVSDLGITVAPVTFPDPSGGASLAVPFEIGGDLPDGSHVKYGIVAINGRGVQSAPVSGTVRVSGGIARGMVRQKLAPGRYQLRLQAEADRGVGVVLANVQMLAPNSEVPACGGFMLLQTEAGAPRPNVTRRLARARPVIAAMVLSARDTLSSAVMALVARRPGAAPDVEIPISRPQRIAAGLWRIEAGIPPSTFSGDIELVLLVNEQPVANCRAELRFE